MEEIMLILDFDGNFTEVEQEAEPFVSGYLDDLAALLGKPIEAVQDLADSAYRKIAGDPSTHGWRFGGQIMAPATVDPYLRMSAIASVLLGQIGSFPEGFLDRLCNLLFTHHYRHTRDVPKPTTTWTLLEAYRVQANAWIVTNSGTSAVQAKLSHMLDNSDREDRPIMDWWMPRIIGDARKFDPSVKPEVGVVWPYADTSFRFPGFPRDTVIKRPHYFGVLDRLRGQSVKLTRRPVVEWGEVLVVGDIFELDLALPLWLGCHVGLMVNQHTPQWEIDFVSSHPRCRVLRSPQEIMPFYASIHA